MRRLKKSCVSLDDPEIEQRSVFEKELAFFGKNNENRVRLICGSSASTWAKFVL
jgi:hypothetical protein